MDSLDTRVLRQLLAGGEDPLITPDFRRSFRAMAKGLGVSEGTVRNRVEGLSASGFLGEWQLRTHPHLWGGRDAALWLDVPARVDRADLLEQLRLVPGVQVVTRFYSSFVTVRLRYTAERALRKRVALIRKLAKPSRMWLGDFVYPPCDLTILTSDLEVLMVLEEDPRKPHAAIARELGLSSRTIQRKLQRLIHGRAVWASAHLNVMALNGVIMASLMVVCEEGTHEKTARVIAARLEPNLWQMYRLRPLDPSEAAFYGFNLMLPNVPGSRSVVEWVRSQGGVTEAWVDFFEEIITPREPFEEYVRTRSPASAGVAAGRVG